MFLVIPFIPCSHIFGVGFVLAERLLYLPSIGFCVLIAYGFEHIRRIKYLVSYSYITGFLFHTLLFVLMLRTLERSIEFQNNTRLFRSAIRVVPNNARMFYNLAKLEDEKGNYLTAIKYNLRANKLKPNDVRTLVNLGNSFRHFGEVEGAIKWHQKATQIEYV